MIVDSEKKGNKTAGIKRQSSAKSYAKKTDQYLGMEPQGDVAGGKTGNKRPPKLFEKIPPRQNLLGSQDPKMEEVPPRVSRKTSRTGKSGEMPEISRQQPANRQGAVKNLRRPQPRRNVRNKQEKPSIKVIFLGGLNEIGKNMTLFECGDDMFLLDCGMAFPDGDMLGVDLVLPDFSYVERNRDRIRGIVLTHGHEDHIGSFPYLLKIVNLPI